MPLDPTAREANFRDSIKKFCVDNYYIAEGIDILFDRWLSTPNIAIGKNVNRWITINFGSLERDTVSTAKLMIYCCTRNDSEGFRLAQLTDTVIGYLSDTDSTSGMKTITFYRSRVSGAWTNIGGILVIPPIRESHQGETEDGTKFKLLTVTCKFASKV